MRFYRCSYNAATCERLGKALSVRPSLSDLLRFLACIQVVDGHWIWKRRKNPKGYGQFKCFGSCHYAHRIAYVAFKGEIPEGMTVNHKKECLNPSCVHPDCLELMTVEDNTAEGNRRRGENEDPIPD
jgi:hypothetical protein